MGQSRRQCVSFDSFPSFFERRLITYDHFTAVLFPKVGYFAISNRVGITLDPGENPEVVRSSFPLESCSLEIYDPESTCILPKRLIRRYFSSHSILHTNLNLDTYIRSIAQRTIFRFFNPYYSSLPVIRCTAAFFKVESNSDFKAQRLLCSAQDDINRWRRARIV